MRAQDIMTTPAVGVRPSTALREIAALLVDRGFTAAPVTDDDGRLLGIVSEADLIRERFGLHTGVRCADDVPPPRTTARDVMTSPVEFVGPRTEVSVLAKCLVTGRRRCVPVVDGGVVVGVVTRRDVVETIACSDESILESVHHRLDRLGLPSRWLVRVQAGVVHLWGDVDPAQQREATSTVESVPGVVRVTVSGPAMARRGSAASPR